MRHTANITASARYYNIKESEELADFKECVDFLMFHKKCAIDNHRSSLYDQNTSYKREELAFISILLNKPVKGSRGQWFTRE